MRTERYPGGPLVAGLMLMLVGSCADPSPTSPPPAALSTASAPTLLQCPAPAPQSASATLGPLGGTVSAAGNRIVFPVDALTRSSVVSLGVPGSKYVEIEATVDGQEHHQFAAPVTVTIDYSRCPSGSIRGPLSVWHIDGRTKALLERMPATDDPLTRTIRFTTDHFSSYSVAQ